MYIDNLTDGLRQPVRGNKDDASAWLNEAALPQLLYPGDSVFSGTQMKVQQDHFKVLRAKRCF